MLKVFLGKNFITRLWYIFCSLSAQYIQWKFTLSWVFFYHKTFQSFLSDIYCVEHSCSCDRRRCFRFLLFFRYSNIWSKNSKHNERQKKAYIAILIRFLEHWINRHKFFYVLRTIWVFELRWAPKIAVCLLFWGWIFSNETLERISSTHRGVFSSLSSLKRPKIGRTSLISDFHAMFTSFRTHVKCQKRLKTN